MFQWLLFFTFTLLLSEIVLGKGNNNVQARDRVWKAKKTLCEEEDCAHLRPEENYNCVNKCVSPACYEKIYANKPLEDGEIDHDRCRYYLACVRSEAIEQTKVSSQYMINI